MEDVVKKINTFATAEEAISYLQKIYDLMDMQSEPVEIISHGLNKYTVHKGFLNSNSIVNYSMYFGEQYKTSFKNSLSYVVKYIRDNNIKDKNDFMQNISKFTVSYLGIVDSTEDRRSAKIQEMLNQAKTDAKYFDIINNISIEYFKEKGIGQCTEFATLTTIITSLIGIEVYFMMGEVKFDNKEGSHAFNIVKNSNGYFLLDNALPHIIYDREGNICDIKNNVYKIKNELVEDFMTGKTNIIIPLYNGMINEDGTIKVCDGKYAEYTCYGYNKRKTL